MPDAVVIGPAAGPLRRRLGPTAWVVLEAVVAHGRPVDGADTAPVSARSLAIELGFAKNTVARSLSALVGAGLLEGVQARVTSGRFARGAYRMSVPVDVLAPASSVAASSVRARAAGPAARAPRSASRVVEQLVLLPE